MALAVTVVVEGVHLLDAALLFDHLLLLLFVAFYDADLLFAEYGLGGTFEILGVLGAHTEIGLLSSDG